MEPDHSFKNKKYMKFLLTTVLAVTLLSGAATAQHVNFGIKGGVNLYNIKNDNNSTYDNSVGFHLGLLAHIHLAKQFAMQPEVVFSTQGANYTVGSTDGQLNLDYVNVPLMFQYMFDNGFRFQAGPQVGFLINAKSKFGNTSTEVKNNFNGVDLGVGAGMSYVHPPSGFGFDARYNFGLNDINENNSVNSNNRGLQLGVFYLFKHKS
jgi:hypothetical protein